MRVQSISDAQALQSEPDAKPAEQPNDLKELVSAVVGSTERSAQNARATTAALIALAQGLSQRPIQVEVRNNGVERPLRWKFHILRDEDGFTEWIIADAEDR